MLEGARRQWRLVPVGSPPPVSRQVQYMSVVPFDRVSPVGVGGVARRHDGGLVFGLGTR